jgi:starch synthase
MICRFAEQKGVDLVLANRDFFLAHDCRFVVLGAGDKRMEEEMRALAAAAPQGKFRSPRNSTNDEPPH